MYVQRSAYGNVDQPADREDGKSECCAVEVQIVIEKLLQVKTLLTSIWCSMAKYFT